MNKIIIIFFLIIQIIELSNGQKFDRNWLIGRNGSSSTFYDGSLLEFNDTNLNVLTHKRKMSFDCDNLSMSDSLGNLIFYSNGFTIDGTDFETIENGDDLNYCQSKGCSITGFGLINYQGIICFPFKNDRYIILHNQVKIFEKDKILAPFSLSLLQSKVELNKETKKYIVTKKNQEIIADTLGPGALVATKHANGRDWWCIMKRGITKDFFTVLITQDSAIINPIQEFTQIPKINYGHAYFTQDGSKYIFQEIYDKNSGYIIIFDFDRCTGILSNPIIIKENYTDSGSYGGLAVSPNSRFLYISQDPYLFQLDLDSLNIQNPFDTIAKFDGFKSPLSTYFFYMQNGPDGKIYMCTLNATDVLHVINKPDEKGKVCNFTQHSVKLIGTNSFSLPNFPNYKLGPLIGSGCDTLSTSIKSVEEIPKISVYPNPVSSTLSIELNNKLSHEKSFKLAVYQLSGKEIYKGDIPAFAYIHNIDVSNWPAGMYYFSVTDDRYRSFNGKFIVVNRW